MQVGWDDLMSHRQQYFYDAGNAGRGLEMSDIRLNGPQHDAPVRCTLTDHLRQGLDLDRITERSACTVRFEVTDLIRRDGPVRESSAHDRLLRQSAWCRQHASSAVLINR